MKVYKSKIKPVILTGSMALGGLLGLGVVTNDNSAQAAILMGLTSGTIGGEVTGGSPQEDHTFGEAENVLMSTDFFDVDSITDTDASPVAARWEVQARNFTTVSSITNPNIADYEFNRFIITTDQFRNVIVETLASDLVFATAPLDWTQFAYKDANTPFDQNNLKATLEAIMDPGFFQERRFIIPQTLTGHPQGGLFGDIFHTEFSPKESIIPPPAGVPEPNSLVVLGIATLAFSAARVRRSRKKLFDGDSEQHPANNELNHG